MTISCKNAAAEWNLVSTGSSAAGNDQAQTHKIRVVHQQHPVLVRELAGGFGEDRVRDHNGIRCVLVRCGRIDFLNRLVADNTIVELALNDNPAAILLGNDVSALIA